MKTLVLAAILISQAALAAAPVGVGLPGGSSNAGTGGTLMPTPAGIPGGSPNAGTGGTSKPTPIGVPGGSSNSGTGGNTSPRPVGASSLLPLDPILFPGGGLE